MYKKIYFRNNLPNSIFGHNILNFQIHNFIVNNNLYKFDKDRGIYSSVSYSFFKDYDFLYINFKEDKTVKFYNFFSDIDAVGSVLSGFLKLELYSNYFSNGVFTFKFLNKTRNRFLITKDNYYSFFISQYNQFLPVLIDNIDDFNFDRDFHFLIVGSTGTGKSQFLKYLVCVLTQKNYEINIFDFKNSEISLFANDSNVYNSSESITNRLSEINKIILDRYKVLENFRRSDDYISKKRNDIEDFQTLDIKRLVIVFDEFVSYLSSFSSTKEKKKVIDLLGNILRLGRECGVNVILTSQSANADLIPTSLKNNFGAILLLGQTTEVTKRTILGEDFGKLPNIEGIGFGYYKNNRLGVPRAIYTPYLEFDLLIANNKQRKGVLD